MSDERGRSVGHPALAMAHGVGEVTTVGDGPWPPVLCPILTVPGWTGSGPDHWQSRWERADPTIRRVEQADWNAPDVAAWVATLDAAVRATPVPPVLVAHSLGCLAVAHWAARQGASAGARSGEARVAGAMLVAPPDVERADTPQPLVAFAPVPRERLPFPSVVVASRDDPFAAVARAAALAAAWGAEWVDAGAAGHLNTASGLGEWAAGRGVLAALLARCETRR